MRNRIFIALILFLLTGAFFLFNGKNENRSRAEQNFQPEKIQMTFGLVDWPGYLGLYIARDLDFFTEEGLEVEFKEYASLQELSKDYQNGEIDGRVNMISDAVAETCRGFDHKIVLIVDYKNSSDVVYPGVINDVITFETDFTRKNPEAVLAFSRAYFRGVNFFKHYPDKAVLILAKKFNIAAKSVEEQLSDLFIPDLGDNETAFAFAPGSQSIYGALRRDARFLESKHGKSNGFIDTDNMIESRFIFKLSNQKER